MRPSFFFTLVLATTAVAAQPGPTYAQFSADVLASVVRVMPDWPGNPPEAPEGTAVAVLPGGFIATNVHVLGAATQVDVRLADGRQVAAEIVGRDPPTDIALLRVPVELPVPPIGPPPPLGAPVCAIGNMFGLGLSVTCGVVSATRRTGTGFNPIEDFIQTDAVVNPGGSGGALVDGNNRLVGMVSAIFTKQSDSHIGVNFAASAALVLRVVEDLRDHGRVRRGRVGLGVADLGDTERKAGAVGARLIRVAPNSPAEAVGLRTGDVITTIGGRPIRSRSDVPAAVHLHRPGDAIEIAFTRDGKAGTVTVTLAP